MLPPVIVESHWSARVRLPTYQSFGKMALTVSWLVEMKCSIMNRKTSQSSWNFARMIVVIWMGAHLSLLRGADSKSYPVLSGVGIALGKEDGGIVVRKVLPGSPAFRSGFIAEGAHLVSVEALGLVTPLAGRSVGEAASLIRGPVGTEIILNVKSALQKRVIPVRLERAPLEIAGIPDSSYQSFIGKPLPELPLKAFGGETVSQLAELRGKIVVLDFWASWCATCYEPVTRMQSFLSKNPQWHGKVNLVAISIDSNLMAAERVIKKKGWSQLTHRIAEVAAFNEIGLSVIPLVIILNQDGIVSMMSGAHALDIEMEVNALLGD